MAISLFGGNISLWVTGLTRKCLICDAWSSYPFSCFLISWVHVSVLTSICEWNTSSSHLGPSATTTVICLPGMRPVSDMISSLQSVSRPQCSPDISDSLPHRQQVFPPLTDKNDKSRQTARSQSPCSQNPALQCKVILGIYSLDRETLLALPGISNIPHTSM